MAKTISGSVRFYLNLIFGIVVCQNSRHYPPTDRNHLPSTRSSSGLQVERLLTLESEVISFCLVALEEDEKLIHDVSVNHNYTHIKRFLVKTRRLNDVALTAADVTVSHPLLVLRLKRRITVTWPPVLEEIKSSDFLSVFLRTAIGSRFLQLSGDLLRQSDPRNATTDILFLQRFYRLQTSVLADGCVYGACVEPLTLDEVKVIAEGAIEEEDHPLALEWIETRSGPNCGKLCNSSSLEEQMNFKTLRASSLLLTARYQEAKTAYEELLLSNSSNLAVNSILSAIEQRLKVEEGSNASELKKSARNSGIKWAIQGNAVLDNHSTLCRGEVQQRNEGNGSSLNCYSVKSTADNASVNVEILHRNPSVFMVHNFFLENQMEAIHQTAKVKLLAFDGPPETPQPLDNEGGDRIELSGNDKWMDIIGSQFRNVTYPHTVDWAECSNDTFHLMVTSIGVGWKQTLRSAGVEEIAAGRSIGQFYVFLNQPGFGGSLVFPGLNVKVEPKKGDAVFWQIRSSGSVADDISFSFLEYLECPVLLGTQWVAKLSLMHPVAEIIDFYEKNVLVYKP